MVSFLSKLRSTFDEIFSLFIRFISRFMFNIRQEHIPQHGYSVHIQHPVIHIIVIINGHT